MNVVNAYEDPRFDPSVDEGTGFHHRNILCMAIKNSCGQIIGVIQVIFIATNSSEGTPEYPEAANRFYFLVN